MPDGRDYLPLSISPNEAALWKGQADLNGDSVGITIDLANFAPKPTAAAWSYAVPFRLVGSVSGEVIPYTGTIGAGATDTSSAGTASVSSATPDVVMGRGTVTLSGDAAAWLNAETATLTLTYSKIRGSGTVTKTCVLTFTT